MSLSHTRAQVERVRSEKDAALRAAVAKAKEESESVLRLELQRIKASETAAQGQPTLTLLTSCVHSGSLCHRCPALKSRLCLPVLRLRPLCV